MSTAAERAAAEIVRMHGAIESWVAGRLAEEDFDKEITDHLAPGFCLVEPSGALLKRDQMLPALREFRGRNPRFGIAIEDVEILMEQGDMVLVTYVERQSGVQEEEHGIVRRATCLLEVGDRITHHALHETWLPKPAS